MVLDDPCNQARCCQDTERGCTVCRTTLLMMTRDTMIHTRMTETRVRCIDVLGALVAVDSCCCICDVHVLALDYSIAAAAQQVRMHTVQFDRCRTPAATTYLSCLWVRGCIVQCVPLCARPHVAPDHAQPATVNHLQQSRVSTYDLVHVIGTDAAEAGASPREAPPLTGSASAPGGCSAACTGHTVSLLDKNS